MWIDFKNVRLGNICCIKCKKSIICLKALLLSSIHNNNKCTSKNKKIFMEQELIEILKVLGLIDNIEKYQNI